MEIVEKHPFWRPERVVFNYLNSGRFFLPFWLRFLLLWSRSSFLGPVSLREQQVVVDAFEVVGEDGQVEDSTDASCETNPVLPVVA